MACIKGIDFLLNVNLGYKFTIGKKVLVIGGGNVAMDVARSAAREVLRQHAARRAKTRRPRKRTSQAVAAREMMDISLSALRMGAQEVSLVCLEKSRGDAGRAGRDRRGGDRRHHHASGLWTEADSSAKTEKSTALEVLKTKTVFDENHRFNPAFYENSETQY